MDYLGSFGALQAGALGRTQVKVPQIKRWQPERSGGELSARCPGVGSHGSRQGQVLQREQAKEGE